MTAAVPANNARKVVTATADWEFMRTTPSLFMRFPAIESALRGLADFGETRTSSRKTTGAESPLNLRMTKCSRFFMKQAAGRNGHNLIADALNILKDADSVELKVSVPERDHRSAVAALDIDVLDAEPRQVVFFDTPDLKLNTHGVVLRARRIPDGGDTVVKLRPVVPSELSSKLRRSGSFMVELDAMPGAIVCSASLKGRASNADVKSVISGKQPIRKLFNAEQRAFYKKYVPGGLDFDALTPIGPINILKLKFTSNGFKRFLVAEMWFYPDGSRILEISTKCAPNKAFQVLGEIRTFLTHRGISLLGKQETKTRKTLQYFSRMNRRAVTHSIGR
jgi:hypothetical protein